LAGVRHVPSPNCDARPLGAEIDLVIVHGISLPPGQYGGNYIDQFFTNALSINVHPYFQGISGLKVSAHALIRRTGEITQYVPLHLRAWHAGLSSFQERPACNDFSIGIELEGSDHDPYEEGQYLALARLTRLLMSHWPGITGDRVVGHSDIAPGRKTDPGPWFDWDRFRNLMNIKNL
jgi:AmpD protein